MAEIFDRILSQGVRAGQIPAKSRQAREWYRRTSQEFQLSTQRLLHSDPDRLQAQIRVGSMYLYNYDPKHKKKLPYYDKFPLVFPFKKVKGGFLGMNMHYLPHKYRAKLMDALYSLANNRQFDESTKLQLNYQILNDSGRFRYFRPTIKHYLTDHLRSRLFYIYPSEWDIALWLPLQRFAKGGESEAYRDARAMIRKK